jgi:hypothetical protein
MDELVPETLSNVSESSPTLSVAEIVMEKYEVRPVAFS